MIWPLLQRDGSGKNTRWAEGKATKQTTKEETTAKVQTRGNQYLTYSSDSVDRGEGRWKRHCAGRIIMSVCPR